MKRAWSLQRKFQWLWNFTTVTTETIQRLKNLEDRLQGACVRNFLDQQSSVLTLALSRGTTTPYSSTTGAIGAAAPNLVPAQTTITVKINGTACTSDATCVTMMIAGQTAVVKATYPCDLTVMGHNYAPSTCNLSAQTAQMIQ